MQTSRTTTTSGVGDYIATGLGLEKASTTSEQHEESIFGGASTVKSSSSLGSNTVSKLSAHTSLLPHNNASSATLPSSVRNGSSSATPRPTGKASMPATNITRTVEPSVKPLGVSTKNSTHNATDCWAQWTSYWSQSAAVPGHYVNVSGSFMTTTETFQPATKTNPLGLPVLATSTTTVTNTIYDNGHPIGVTASVSTWDTFLPQSTEYSTETSTIIPASSSLVAGNQTVPPPSCGLPSIVPQCQEQWDTWASMELATYTVPEPACFTSFNVSEASGICAAGRSWASATSSFHAARTLPTPLCSQASVATDVCESFRTGYMSSWVSQMASAEFTNLLTEVSLAQYTASLQSVGFQPTTVTAPNGSVSFTNYWPSASSLAAGCSLGCGDCAITAGTVQLFYWPIAESSTLNATSVTQSPTLNTSSMHAKRDYEPLTISTFGTSFVAVSPTVYVFFSKIYASNSCGPIGLTHTSTFIPFANTGELSSIWQTVDVSRLIWDAGIGGSLDVPSATAPFNFTDLNTPVPASIYDRQPWCVTWSTDQMAYTNPYDPALLAYTTINETCPQTRSYDPVLIVPLQSIQAIDPRWSTCKFDLKAAFDPPYALQETNAPAQPTPSSAMPTISATPAPAPRTSQPVQTTVNDPRPLPASTAPASAVSPSEDPGGPQSSVASLLDPKPSNPPAPVASPSKDPGGLGSSIASLLNPQPFNPPAPSVGTNPGDPNDPSSSGGDPGSSGGDPGSSGGDPGSSGGDPGSSGGDPGSSGSDPGSSGGGSGSGDPVPVDPSIPAADPATQGSSPSNPDPSPAPGNPGASAPSQGGANPPSQSSVGGTGGNAPPVAGGGSSPSNPNPAPGNPQPGNPSDPSSDPSGAGAGGQPAGSSGSSGSNDPASGGGNDPGSSGPGSSGGGSDPASGGSGTSGGGNVPGANPVQGDPSGQSSSGEGQQGSSGGGAPGSGVPPDPQPNGQPGLGAASTIAFSRPGDPASPGGPSAEAASPVPGAVFTVGGSSYTAVQTGVPGQSSQVVIPSGSSLITLSAGGPAATIGTGVISVAPSGIAVGSSVQSFSSLDPAPGGADSPNGGGSQAQFTVAGTVYTALRTGSLGNGGEVIIPSGSGLVTLSIGGPAATVGTQVISAGSNGLVQGGSTRSFSLANSPSAALGSEGNAPQAQFTISGTPYTALQTSVPGHSGEVVIPIGSFFTTISPGGAPATIGGQIISAGSSGLVMGSNTQAYGAAGAGAVAPFTVSGQAYTAIQTSVAGHPGEVIIPLGSSSAILSPGGSAVTLNGQTISAASGGLVVGGSTEAYGPADPASIAPFTVSGHAYTAIETNAGDHSEIIIPSGSGFITLSPGGAAATIGGQIVSAAPSGLVVGSSTEAFIPASQESIAPFTVGGQAYTAYETSVSGHGEEIVIPSGSAFVTLTPGGSAVTIGDQLVSAVSTGLVVGSSTEAFSAVGPETIAPFTVAGQAYTAFETSVSGKGEELIIPSGSGFVTLLPGGSAATIGGEVVSAASNGLVVGGSTEAFSTTTGIGLPQTTSSGSGGASGSTSSGDPQSPPSAGHKLKPATLLIYELMLGIIVMVALL